MRWLLVVAVLGLGDIAAQEQQVRILALDANGMLSWTNSSLGGTCRVQWASTAEGPWHESWDLLKDITVTDSVMETPVPRFFRIVCEPPPEPRLTDVSPTEALRLLEQRHGEPDFVVLDVRTPGEFNPGHIRSAQNIDFRNANFTDQVSALDRTKTYLVYCRSGGRSRAATEQMHDLGFLDVYNLTTGFNGFTSTAGAAEWVEP